MGIVNNSSPGLQALAKKTATKPKNPFGGALATKYMPAPSAPAVHVEPVAAAIPPIQPSADPSAGQATPSFKDAAYYASADDANRAHDLGIAGLDHKDAYALTDRDTRIRDLATSQANDTKSARESANKAGLFYSTFLTNNLNNLTAQYGNQQAGAQEAYRRAIGDDADQRSSLDLQRDANLHALAQAAIDRQVAQDQQEQAPYGVGAGLNANGTFAGVQYAAGVPQGDPTLRSVEASKSLLGTGLDIAKYRKPAKK